MILDLKNKKHLFFDMDDTVTMTRTPMENDVYELYAALTQNVIIVSGAQCSQIKMQVRSLPFYCLGQNGNQALDPKGGVLWEELLDATCVETINAHIHVLRHTFPRSVRDESDLVENRGAQISYSLIGHHEAIEVKKSFDPDHCIRESILKSVPLISDEVEVKIAGTTGLDYFKKGRNKGYNIQKLIDSLGWNKNECVYFGDALFEGGNDESVVGVIDTFPVRNHRHTYDVLRENFI